ncbi:hypothetical protein TGME49_219660 [Toxoplasma gondii ME49]|uniref:Uncharacterized protein n=1 Tax=Toxoplasma gondii (strain ATCC 50611 / Me49) TaxID=508771 RepID=S8EMY5_TOXGM|nr:hypothetical protein TGME49_219660 [Toxoplasma gondii ME49]EPT24591.1 hypothetical protein TGME49_219660 [Toxoplasma gondii ME49]|eukprot:XP_002370718.1 hypothetical protein TGME49_219660 [Toxoplasma gondii ME49]
MRAHELKQLNLMRKPWKMPSWLLPVSAIGLFVAVRLSADLVSVLCPAPPGNSVVDPPSFSTGFLSPSVLCVAAGDADDAHNAESEDPPAPAEADPLGSSSLSQRFYHAMTTPLPDVLVGPETAEQRLEKEVRLIHGLRAHEVEVDNVQKQKKQAVNPVDLIGSLKTYSKDVSQLGKRQESGVHVKRANILIQQVRATSKVLGRMARSVRKGEQAIAALLKDAKALAGSKSVPERVVTAKLDLLQRLKTSVDTNTQLADGQVKAKLHFSSLLGELFDELKWLGLNGVQTHEARRLQQEGRAMRKQVAVKLEKLMKGHAALRKAARRATSVVDTALFSILKSSLARGKRIKVMARRVKEQTERLDIILAEANDAGRHCRKLQKKAAKSRSESVSLHIADRSQTLLETVVRYVMISKQSLAVGLSALNDISSSSRTLLGVVELEPVASSDVHRVQATVADIRSRAQTGFELHDMLTEGLNRDTRAVFRALRLAYGQCDAASKSFWTSLRKALELRSLPPAQAQQLSHMLSRKNAVAANLAALVVDVQGVMQTALKASSRRRASGMSGAVIELNTATELLKALDAAMTGAYAAQVGVVALPSFVQNMTASLHLLRTRFWSAPHRRLKAVIKAGIQGTARGARLATELEGSFKRLNRQRLQSMQRRKQALYQIQKSVIEAFTAFHRHEKFVGEYNRRSAELEVAEAMMSVAIAALDKRSLENVNRNMNGKGKTKAKKGRRKNVKGTVLDKAKARAFSRAKTKLENNLEAKRAKVKANELARLNMSGKVMKKMKEKRREKERAQAAARRIKEQQRTTTSFEHSYVAVAVALRSFAVLRKALDLPPFPGLKKKERLLHAQLEEVQKVLRTSIKPWTPEVVVRTLKNVEANLGRIVRVQDTVMRVLERHGTLMKAHTKTLSNVLRAFYLATGLMFKTDLRNAKQLLAAAVAGRQDIISAVDKYKTTCGMLQRVTDPQAPPMSFRDAEGLLVAIHKLDSLVDRLWNVFLSTFVSLKETLKTMERREALMPREVKKKSRRSRVDIEAVTKSLWESAFEAHKVLQRVQSLVAKWRVSAAEKLREGIARKLQEVDENQRKITAEAARLTEETVRHKTIVTAGQKLDFSRLNAQRRASWRQDFGKLQEAEAALPAQMHWQEGAAKYVAEVAEWIHARHWSIYRDGSDVDHKLAVRVNKAASNALKELRIAQEALDQLLLRKKEETAVTQLGVLAAHQEALATQLKTRAAAMTQVAQNAKETLRLALKEPEAFQADAKTREKHLVALQSRIKAVLEKYDGAGDPSVNPEDLLKEMDRTNSEVTDLLERHPHLAKHAWTVAKALKHGRGSVSKIRDASKSMGGELEILRSLADTLETDLRVLELNRMLVAAEKRARNTVAGLTRLKELEMEALSDAQHAELAASRTDDWETANTVLARARDLLHKAEKERATWQAALRERQQELSVINEKWDVPDAAKCDAQMRPVVRTVKALRDTVVKLTAEAKELVDAEDTTYTALQQAVTNLEKTTLRRRLVVARHRVEEIARADAVTWKEIAELPAAVDSVRRRLRVFQETLGETTWRNGLSDEAVIKRAAEMDARFDRVAREVKALQTILKRDTGAEEEAEAQEIVAAFAASGQKDATVQADVAKLQQRVSEDQQALAAARKGMKKVNALFAEVSRLDEQRRARDQVYTFRVRQENLVKEITMLVGKQKALKNRLKEQAERGLKLEDVPQSRVDTSALGVTDDPNGDLSKIDSWLQEAQTLLEEGNTQMLSSSEQIQVVDETRRDLRDDMKSAYLKQHPDDVGRFAREGDEQNRRLEQLLHEARNANDAISVALAVLEDQKIKVAAKVAPLRVVVAETEIARMAEAETQLASVIRDLLGRHIRLGEQMLEFRHFLEEQEAFLLQGSAAFTRSRSGKEADEISRRGARIIEAATQLRAAWEAHADDRLALARFQRELATGLLPTEQLKEYATNPNVAEAVRDLVTRRKQNVQLVVQGSKAIQTMGREFADTAKRAGELSKLAQSVRRFFGLSSGQATVRAQLETLAEAAKKTQQGASGLIQQLSTLLSRAEQTTKSGDALDMGPGTRELMDSARMALERNPVEQWHQDLEAIGGQLRQLDDYIASLPHALLDSDIFAEELNNIRLAQGALYKSLERSRAMVDAADRRRFDLHVATTAATDFFHGATLTSAREHVEKLGAEETARHREIELVRSQIEALIRDLKTVLTSASAEGSAAAVDRNASARVQQLLSRRSALEGFAGIISRVMQLVNQREEVVRQLLKRAGTTGPVELAAVPVGEAVAQSKEMLKACESLVSEARALFAAVERLGGDLAILAEVSNARQRQHRLQGEAHRVKALLEQTLVSAQSQIVKVRGAYRSVASDDANGNPNFQQANSVLSVVKLAGRDAATSVVHITQESANLDREIADIEAKTQAATGPVRAQIRQLQAIQGELRVAISQLRGRIALLARAAQELEDAAGDLTGHLKRQALAVAQDQIAAKMKEQEDLAEEVERDEAAVDQLRRDVDRLLAMRQRHADGMDADAGFQPRRLSSQGDHVAKAEELAAHLSETAARVQNAQRELAKSEASWRRFEGLRDPVNALRSLTNKSSRTLDRLGRKLGQILSDLAGLEKVGEASDVGVLISDAHAALDRLSGQADGVVREAREVRGAAQSATEACRQENSAVAILRSSFADNAVYGRRAAVYQEAVATLQIGDAKSRQWSHIVKETEGSWTVLGETVTLLRRVEKNPVVFEGLRKVAERLELLTPMVRQMAGVVNDARAALRKLYEEANALRPHVFAPRPQPDNSLADLELRANSLRSEAEGLLVKAEMAERQSKALGRGRVSRPRRWRHGEPYPTRVDVDGLPDLEAAAQSVRVWREHLQRLREANSQAAREAAKSGRQSARLLATTAETDAALQRLEAMLNDLERDLQRDLLEHQVHSEIHRDRGHDMQRDRDRDIERDTRRDRERDMERDAHRDRERDMERSTRSDRERDMERSTRRDRERDMERSTRRNLERDMERSTRRDRERDTERGTHLDRERDSESRAPVERRRKDRSRSVSSLALRGESKAATQVPPLSEEVAEVEHRMQERVGALGNLTATFAIRKPSEDLTTGEELWAGREALQHLEMEARKALGKLEDVLGYAASVKRRLEAARSARAANSADGSENEDFGYLEKRLEAAVTDGRASVASANEWLREDTMTTEMEGRVRRLFSDAEAVRDALVHAEQSTSFYKQETAQQRTVFTASAELVAKFEGNVTASGELERATCHCVGRCPLNDLQAAVAGLEKASADAKATVKRLTVAVDAARHVRDAKIRVPAYMQGYIARAQNLVRGAHERLKELQRDRAVLDDDLAVSRAESQKAVRAVHELFRRILSQRLASVSGVAEQIVAKKNRVFEVGGEVQRLLEQLERMAKLHSSEKRAETVDQAVATAEMRFQEAEQLVNEMQKLHQDAPERWPLECGSNSFVAEDARSWQRDIEKSHRDSAGHVAAAVRRLVDISVNVEAIKGVRDTMVAQTAVAESRLASGREFLLTLKAAMQQFSARLDSAQALLTKAKSRQRDLPVRGDFADGLASASVEVIEQIAQDLAKAGSIATLCRQQVSSLRRYTRLSRTLLGNAEASEKDEALLALADLKVTAEEVQRETTRMRDVAAAVGKAESRLASYARKAAAHSVDVLLRTAGRRDRQSRQLVGLSDRVAGAHAKVIKLQTERFHVTPGEADPTQEAKKRLEETTRILSQEETIAKQVDEGSALVRGGVAAIRAVERALDKALLNRSQAKDLAACATEKAETTAAEQLRRARSLVREMTNAISLAEVNETPLYLSYPFRSAHAKSRSSESPDPSPAHTSVSVEHVAEKRRQAQANLSFFKTRLESLKAAGHTLEEASKKQRAAAVKLKGLAEEPGDKVGGTPRRLEGKLHPAVRGSDKVEQSLTEQQRQRIALILAAKQDVSKAQKALAEANNAIQTLSEGQEEAANRLRQLETSRDAVRATARKAPAGSDISVMYREIEEMVEEGRRLYAEYSAQLKRTASQRAKVERELEQQIVTVKQLFDSVQTSEASLFGGSVEEARKILAQMEHDSAEAQRLVDEIRKLIEETSETYSESRSSEARRLLGRVNTITNTVKKSSKRVLETIDTLESSAYNNIAASLRDRLEKIQGELEARRKEAEEALLRNSDHEKLLVLIQASDKVRHTTTQVTEKAKELRAVGAELSRLSADLERTANKPEASDSTAEFWTKTATAFLALQNRVNDATNRATGLGTSAQALVAVAKEDLRDAHNVWSQCRRVQDEILIARCHDLAAAATDAGERALGELHASMAETVNLQTLSRAAEHEAKAALLALAKQSLWESMAKAEKTSTRSNSLLAELRQSAGELRALVEAASNIAEKGESLGETEDQLQVERSKGRGQRMSVVDPELIVDAERIAGRGAALAKNLTNAVGTMRATVVPEVVVELLNEPSLAAGIEQHAKSVQAQAQAWESEVAMVLAEMQDLVSELQAANRTNSPANVRHEVVANLAAVNSLLHNTESDQVETVDTGPELMRATTLLNRAQSLLRTAVDPGDPDTQENADLEAQAESLSGRLQEHMDKHNLNRFEQFVSSTGSGLWSLENLGLPPMVEAALAALARTQSEAADLMREWSRIQGLDQEAQADLQTRLRERLEAVSAETRKALGMLQSSLLSEVQRNDAKLQRFTAILAQGADLASQLTREATNNGPVLMARAVRSDEAVSETPRDPAGILEQLVLLLERVQQEGSSETNESVGEAAAPTDTAALESFRRLAENFQGDNAVMRRSVDAAAIAFQRATRSEQQLNETQGLAFSEKSAQEAPAAFVERLSSVMQKAENDRKNLEVGLGVSLGVVLFLIVIVAVVLMLVRRRYRRRLLVLTRCESKEVSDNNAVVAPVES